MLESADLWLGPERQDSGRGYHSRTQTIMIELLGRTGPAEFRPKNNAGQMGQPDYNYRIKF
jgi:hypothetical protein